MARTSVAESTVADNPGADTPAEGAAGGVTRAGSTRRGESVVGLGALIRLILRRDRIRLPLWFFGITGLTLATSRAVPGLYDTEASRAEYAATVDASGAAKMINGTPYDVTEVGGIAAYESTSLVTVLVALMVTLLVIRHTRAEEESGRAELLRAGVVGRHAATAAAVLLAVAASLVIGLLDAAVLTALDFGAGSAVAHGLSLTGIGIFFTGVAAAAAQVTAAARTALGLAGAVMGVLFAIRGIGAVTDSWVRLASPFGWVQEIRPYGPTQYGWLALLLLVAVAAVGLAVFLTAHRDAGAGLLQPRPGSLRATLVLPTSLGLAGRLQRGAFIGWLIGLGLLALLYGALGSEVESMVAESSDIAAMMAIGDDDSVLDGFFGFVLLVTVVVASAFTITSVLRLRTEEDSGRADVLLATRLSRIRWSVGSLTITLLSSLAIVVMIGVGMGLANGVSAGDWSYIGTLAGAALALAPGVLLVGGIAVLLVGWLPKWAPVVWAVFGFSVLQAYLGELLQMPDWLAAFSPFWHLPQLPAEEFTPWPGAVMLILAAAATTAGLVGLRRRDFR